MMTTFTDLPVELLDRICVWLCPHCRPFTVRITKPSIDSRPTSDDWERDRLYRTTLFNLCLTSKALRRVAQPVLFHRFLHHDNRHWQTPRTGLTLRLFELLRTIDERPSLAGLLRCVDINAFERNCTCCRRGSEPITPEQNGLVTRLASKTGLAFETAELELHDLPECLIQLLLASARNLSGLNLCAPRWWTFCSLALWASRSGHQTFLPWLKRMELAIDNHESDACLGPHNESCNHPTTSCSIERLLVDAAPNLKLLSCTAGALNSLPLLPALKWLEIHVHGSWEGMLPQLMRGLPRLTHLTVIARNKHCPTPNEIQNSLAGHRDTLEYLNVVQHRWMSQGWRPSTEKYAMTSLAEFTALKTINLDGYMIWPDRGGMAANQMVPADLELLPEFLPECVQQLHVDLSDNYGDESFRSLAEAKTKGRFPQLDAVFWRSDGIHNLMLAAADRSWAAGDEWKAEVPLQVARWMEDQGHSLAFPDWRALRLKIDPTTRRRKVRITS
ncbi:F-box domain protein [Colletotrichum higginsianum IMI 349063]|uniref:F-box domain protein n=2 Tax=Colletotrichum higginsianum TaxID=80884 RepID=A0A1B7XWQ4_COLHI|nr:F-box domain protein [Colletotrichum higginsianum IMI 349063]OBR04203.1 F-box domain protein [Colletotrichum higginsianum IMI 349063]TIC90313.1 hypothetical protein CH35J_012178 [Colletotrichum higginsianum]